MNNVWWTLTVGLVLGLLTDIKASDGALDVMLLLDSSDSYRSEHFDEEKNFAKGLAGRLLNNSVHIGLYTFGEHTHRQFGLNDYHDLAQFNQHITYLWYSTGDGSLGAAINFTVHDGFSATSGDRECTPNVLVILTHTVLTGESITNYLSSLLDTRIIRTFVLNMAAVGVDSQSLVTLTNDTSRVISVTSYTDLSAKLDTLVHKIQTDVPRSGCGQLTGWEKWSRCSRSCNAGRKYRLRSCTKIRPTDKDCDELLSEDAACNLGKCAEPVDGDWGNWQAWSVCTQTCGNGTQTRYRSCDEPVAANGGKPCPGTNTQNRICANWKCPDCNAPCPPGAHREHCEYCVCSDVSLFGRIMDNINEPVKQAPIFLESMMYKRIATTDDWGYFNTTSICLLNETIYIEKHGYAATTALPIEVNATHWTLNTTVDKYVPPIIQVQPEDKLRISGQRVTLCCVAAGYPTPQEYKWYKDGVELEDVGTNGTLSISPVQISDQAAYRCSVETEAGVTQSETANITVTAIGNSGADTCRSPIPKLQLLPEGCYREGDTSKSRSVDVRTCGKGKCLKTSLQDNGTCSDGWADHCCDVGAVETVNITCDGYSYSRTIVSTCKCRPCVKTTVVAGRAFGRSEGQEVPLQLGIILSNGQEAGRTNMAGYFRFEVAKGIKRVVVTFHDDVFKKFVDSSKIVNVVEGHETPVVAVLPLKPKPAPFTSSLGHSIELGNKTKGVPAAGSLSIEADSLMTAEGHPYSGRAKASVHFMDPRSRDDMETSNGDFVYESPGGDKRPLRTFGMFHVGVEDDSGNPLNINKDITFSLDASLFNITLDKQGEPDLSLWYYDTNKGIWVEQSKMVFSGVRDGRRRLLSGMITGTVPPFNVPIMDPFTYHVEKRFTGRYTNCDHSVKLYEDVKIKDDNPKDGVCYVSVSVYTDQTMNERANGDGIQVTAFSQELDGSAYLATETKKVDDKGHVCMTIFCDKFVYINVKGKGNKRLLPTNHMLPYGYEYYDREAEHEVKFVSRFLGEAYDCAQDNRSSNCKGPVFPYSGAKICDGSGTDDSFRFNFAPFTQDPELVTALGTTDINDDKLSWYPLSPERKFYRTCFIKVTVKVKDTFDLRLSSTSYQGGHIHGAQYGTYEVGPEPSPDMIDKDTRGACIEYRCAGFVQDGTNVVLDLPTTVKVTLTAAGKPKKCTQRLQAKDANITSTTDGSGFVFVAESGRNYGPSFGIYVHDADRTTVQNFCYSGTDFSSQVDGVMTPTKHAAVEFDCLH